MKNNLEVLFMHVKEAMKVPVWRSTKRWRLRLGHFYSIWSQDCMSVARWCRRQPERRFSD